MAAAAAVVAWAFPLAGVALAKKAKDEVPVEAALAMPGLFARFCNMMVSSYNLMVNSSTGFEMKLKLMTAEPGLAVVPTAAVLLAIYVVGAFVNHTSQKAKPKPQLQPVVRGLPSACLPPDPLQASMSLTFSPPDSSATFSPRLFSQLHGSLTQTPWIRPHTHVLARAPHAPVFSLHVFASPFVCRPQSPFTSASSCDSSISPFILLDYTRPSRKVYAHHHPCAPPLLCPQKTTL